MLKTCFEFLKDRNFLRYLSHSNCFNCSQCSIKGSCQIIDILSIAKKLERVYEDNLPDQNGLKTIFSDN